VTDPFDSLMFRTLLVPIVAALRLFAFYVLIHGHDSPGGGFQAGVLFGASVLLPPLIEGREADDRSTLLRKSLACAAAGVLIYAAIGVTSILLGSMMLDYGALPLPFDPPTRRALGILGIETGVAIAVGAVVVAVFETLAVDEVPA
jgi:multicomponent Na+:H+ antiporter subunit B